MKHVLVLLANGFEAFEGGAFTDVIGWTHDYGMESLKQTSGALHTQIRCTFGFQVVPDVVITPDMDFKEYDALAIPGGFEEAGFYEDAYSDAFLDIIRRFHEEGKPIAAICVGALSVAKSGILNGRRATTYHLLGGRRRRQLGELGANVVDAAIVQDGTILTSTSPATAVELALRLVEMLTSTDNAHKIRTLMGF